MRRLYILGMLLAMVSSLALASCTMRQNQMRESMQQMMGDMLPIGVEPSQLPDPESSGTKLLSQYCPQCHSIPSPRLHTDQEWPFVLTRMVKRMDRMELGGMGMMQVESPSQAELKIDLPQIKVIILTACDDNDYRFEAMRSGAQDYLQKTFRAEELLAVLSTAVNASGNV